METTTIIFVLACILFITNIITIIWAFKTESRLKKFFSGKKARSLEEIMVVIGDDIASLKENHEENNQNIKNLKEQISHCIQSVRMIRFNPFKDAGSNQSFAVSLLDELGDGVVISSLYSRERMSVFAKPIKKHGSEFELTDEEKKVSEK